jgi:hypothetical protein
MSVVVWVDPRDCDPPHGLDLTSAHDANKVNFLIDAFLANGFDKNEPALVGYPRDGRIQLLSGTHRHEAAMQAGTRLPVVFWLQSTIDGAWGELQDWLRVMEDIPVAVLEKWTREDVEARACRG